VSQRLNTPCVKDCIQRESKCTYNVGQRLHTPWVKYCIQREVKITYTVSQRLHTRFVTTVSKFVTFVFRVSSFQQCGLTRAIPRV